MSMTKTTKRFILVFVLLLSTVAALLVLVQQLRSQSLALTEALQTLANQAAVEKAFLSLSQVLASSAAERAEIESYVVSGEQGTIDFLTEIENLAARYQVTMTGTTLKTGTSEALASPIISVSFSFSGPRTLTESYLLALEALPYASYADNLSLTVTEGDSGAQLRGSVTVHAAVKNIDI